MSTQRKRTVVYLSTDLECWLEQEANRHDESVGAVIRRAVRKMMEPKTDAQRLEPLVLDAETFEPVKPNVVLVAEVPKVEQEETVEQ